MDRLKIIFLLIVFLGYIGYGIAGTAGNETAENVEEVVISNSETDANEPENVVEIDVDDATAKRIVEAAQKGEVFEEDGVIVVQSKEDAPVVQVDKNGNEIEDSFVILPEKTAEKERVFGKSMRAVVSDDISDSTLNKILPRIEKAAAEVFYFILPYAAKAGAVLEDVSDEIARKFLGMKPKTAQERAELHKRYAPYVEAGQKASKLRRMVVEFTELVDDEVESAVDRRKRNLARRKSEWRDDFAEMYNDSRVAVVNIKNVVHYRRPGNRHFHRHRPGPHKTDWHDHRKVPVRKPEFLHHRKHRVHYLPPRMSHHHSKKMSKPIVFRNHKRNTVSSVKKIKKINRTKIKMHKKKHFHHAPKKMHKKSAPPRRRR
ncbi:MAG: hypothetical protein IKA71_02350 [Lentisphaeria bacterium]|nr:hypothetical protein [Lentisphaeria bacterium]